MNRLLLNIAILLSLINLPSCGYDDESDVAYPESYLDQSDYTTGNERYNEITENPFITTEEEATSTFSIDTDGASYANTRRFILRNKALAPVDAVRIEELVNYFPFDYESGTSLLSVNSEVSGCPWNTDHHLLRIGVKGKPMEVVPGSNYVFLVDVSGSMSSEDKLDLLKNGLIKFVENMKSDDKLSVVTYAGNATVLLRGGTVDEKEELKKAISRLESGGSTAGAQGILTAYEIAQEQFIKGGNNRIILGTDGDFNVGVSSQDALIALIQEKREEGVYLTVLGLGTGNLNEGMMEQLANNGNGNFEYLDSPAELEKVFVHESAKFFTLAKDVKIQVSFERTKVESYRLIGYENRALTKEEFEEESADAGELGAGQTITAIYQIQLKEGIQTSEKLATVDFKYKSRDSENNLTGQGDVLFTNNTFSASSENMRFAAAVVGFGLLLRNSKYKGQLTWGQVEEWTDNAKQYDPHGWRQAHLELVKLAKNM